MEEIQGKVVLHNEIICKYHYRHFSGKTGSDISVWDSGRDAATASAGDAGKSTIW